jgi:predicted porin
MNGVYGRGITPYINDLMGTPYDITYDPNDPTRLQTLPMWAWQAAAQINIMPNKFWLAGGYSEVHLEKHNGTLSDTQYSRGHYIFANAFYNVTNNFTLALEYLHGGRVDASDAKGNANRLSIMAQYNF